MSSCTSFVAGGTLILRILLLDAILLSATTAQYANQQQYYSSNQYPQQRQVMNSMYPYGQRLNQVNNRLPQTSNYQQSNLVATNGQTFGTQIRKGFTNSPTYSPNSTVGALVTFQIINYENTGLRLSANTTCICPVASCPFIKNHQPSCYLSFITILSAKGQSVQYIASEFLPVSNGQIDLTNVKTQHVLNMTSAPLSVDIIIQHYGLVINKDTGSLINYDSFGVIDAFGVTPQSSSSNTYTFTHTVTGAKLTFTLSWQCIGGKLGPGCDLNCTQSVGIATYAVCTTLDGHKQLCQYTGNQVSNCITCERGFNANQTACLQYDQVITSKIGVSKAYRSWTIVLGVLLGLAVICILVLVCIYIWLENRKQQQENGEPEVASQRFLSNGYTPIMATRPLIEKQDEWDHEPIRPAVMNPVGRNVVNDDITRQSDESFSRSNTGTGPRREAQV